MAYELNQGENLLLQFNLITMQNGLSWQGAYNNLTTYHLNDVVKLDGIVYVNIFGDITGEPPPNLTRWNVLPPILASTIKSMRIELIQGGVVSDVFWRYKVGTPTLPNVRLVDGLLTIELTKEDSKKLSGMYDMRFEFSYKSPDFIASGAQTDSICIPDVLNVSPC